jgi:hypothetical protein
LLGAGLLALGGCPTVSAVDSARPEKADKWFRRATDEFRVAQVDAAHDSVGQALDLVPADEEVRLLGARIALARLEFAEVVRLVKGIERTEAKALLGRAYWYDGKLEQAVEPLQAVLADPDYVDPWAKEVTRLALQGSGRKPFAITGALLASVDLPRVDPRAPLYVIPLEIDGEAALAMVSTATAEVVLDSATRRESSWVSLRFGKRLEVGDVPALTQDLSQLSGQLGAPIKALLGANLLRQLNVTLDFRGRQFVARTYSPPPPPLASRVDLFYMRGGGMLMGTELGTGPSNKAALFIDTAMVHPLALDKGGWQKIGIDAGTLPAVADDPVGKLRTGAVPLLRLGGFELPQVPAVYGAPLERMEQELNVDVDGLVGAGMLAEFRCTFADGGRVLWIEQGLATSARPASAAPAPTPTIAPPAGPTVEPLAPTPVAPSTSSAAPAPRPSPSP